MAHQVLPSKLVDERITVLFEFMDELEWGEAVESVDFELSVISGTDPNPELMLFQYPVISGTTVRHFIQGGNPGVIYLVKAVVTGSTGAAYNKVARLAILPSDAVLPLFLADFYTTTIYPTLTNAAATFTPALIAGTVRTIVVTLDTLEDSVSFEPSIISGRLWQPLQVITLVEGVTFNPTITAGILRTPLVETTATDDALFTPSLTTGSLQEILVVTTYSDGANFTPSLISGSLS